MESDWPVVSHIKPHYKKLIALVTCSATIYGIKKLMDKRKRQSRDNKSKEKRKIKEFPSVKQIQQFIEELPFNTVKVDPSITLKSLLGELSEFSEDEEWKELIASVHSICEEDKGGTTQDEALTEDAISIHEDENMLTFRSVYEPAEDLVSPRETVLSEDDDTDYGSTSSKSNNNNNRNISGGQGDVEKEKTNIEKESQFKEDHKQSGNPFGDAEGTVE